MEAIANKHCFRGLAVIAMVCFTMGFMFQIFFLSSHSMEIPSLRSNQPSDPNMVALSQVELQRLLDIEKKYSSSNQVSADTQPHKSPIETHPPDGFGTLMRAPKTMDLPPTDKIIDLHKLYGSGGEKEVPAIVQAWRTARLDWHSLLPKHNSVWERFGTPQKEGKLRLLVSKEIQATDYLTRFHESGLAARYGHEHGPLLAYSGCDTFTSGCMIHDKEACKKNQLCSWSDHEGYCVEASKSPSSKTCSTPRTFSASGIVDVQDRSQCKVRLVTEVLISLFFLVLFLVVLPCSQ